MQHPTIKLICVVQSLAKEHANCAHVKSSMNQPADYMQDGCTIVKDMQRAMETHFAEMKEYKARQRAVEKAREVINVEPARCPHCSKRIALRSH